MRGRSGLGQVAHRDAGDLEPQAGAGLDGVALGGDQLHQRRADVAAAQHADAHAALDRRHSSRAPS